jgi:predicted nuclease with TOPRIM domain
MALSWFRSKKPPEDVEERLERLEKTVRNLETDWTDVYGKFRRLQMRVAKQVQRLEADEDQTPERGDTLPVESVPENGALSPAQLRAQAQVNARRKLMSRTGDN